VRTKNGKAQVTYLLDVPPLLDVVREWHELVAERLPHTAMWYTPVTGHWGEQELSADLPGENRNGALAKRLRLLVKRAGLPYLSPHKYRHGHAVYALQGAKTMADYKAVSQNLMHADIRVTDGIYAPLLGSEVQRRIAQLDTGVSPEHARDEQPLVNDLLKLATDPNSEVARAIRVLANLLTADDDAK
jgi:integrase